VAAGPLASLISFQATIQAIGAMADNQDDFDEFRRILVVDARALGGAHCCKKQ
jgi:hypothetical protein